MNDESASYPYKEKIEELRGNLFEFLKFFKRRIDEDRILVNAGSLSYTTLLSLVPMMAVMISVLSAFPGFRKLRMEIEDFIFRNFVPTLGEMIHDQMTGFVENASRMTSVGIVALVIVALMLIHSINAVFNDIWRTKMTRRAIASFSIYWTILTLGPVLMGVSITVTSYLVSLTAFSDGSFNEIRNRILGLLPFFSSVLAFLMLYTLVPNRSVRFRSAFAGALTASVLFEISKKGFTLYITNFPSYQAIYGALAAIPILLVWIYLSWVITLFGAELAASLDSFRQDKKKLPGGQAHPET